MMADEKWTLRVKINEIEAWLGIPLKSICLPLDPEFFRKKIEEEGWWDHKFGKELRDLLESAAPEYPDDISKLVSGSLSPEPRKYFDVSLSSTFGSDGYLVRKNGDRVNLNADTFKGKFVLVCCFHAPVAYGSDGFQDLLNFCHQLYSTRDDFEVLMVAWMNSLVDADDHKKFFDHFFSGFPELCLAVPFDDSKRRASMCKLLAGTNSEDFKCSRCLFLDPQGIVMPPFHDDLNNLNHYFGAEAFPFTKEIIKKIAATDKKLLRASSLQQLLRIDEFSPDVVYRFNPGGPRVEMHVSELSATLVGLYLPGENFNLIPTLVKVTEQCRERELEFELVMVYLRNRDELDPTLYQEMIDRMLEKHKEICGHLWCLPMDTSVSLRFSRLTRDCPHDLLLVVGPYGELDLDAGLVMELYEVDGYPFTRDFILERDMQRMKQVTLDSILQGDSVFRGDNPDDVISAEELSGKKICVYFSSLTNRYDYENAVKSYHGLKKKKKTTEFEVIYVHSMVDNEQVECHRETISAMPWYICPFNADRTASLGNRLRICEAAIGFGEDGRVCSCRYPNKFTLDDTLYEDALERCF